MAESALKNFLEAVEKRFETELSDLHGSNVEYVRGGPAIKRMMKIVKEELKNHTKPQKGAIGWDGDV